MPEEGGGIPGFPKPVAHDGDHAGPARGLQQAVHDPQAAVQPLVVEMQPFRDCAEDKHLGEGEKEGHVTSARTHGHPHSQALMFLCEEPQAGDIQHLDPGGVGPTLRTPPLRAALGRETATDPPQPKR